MNVYLRGFVVNQKCAGSSPNDRDGDPHSRHWELPAGLLPDKTPLGSKVTPPHIVLRALPTLQYPLARSLAAR